MEFLLRIVLPTIRALLLTIEAGQTGVQMAARRLATWHRRQMATDPAYPTILAIVAAGILRLTIPNRAQAAILAAMVAKALGLNPPNYGTGWNPEDNYE
jgi:hypothetical protein